MTYSNLRLLYIPRPLSRTPYNLITTFTSLLIANHSYSSASFTSGRFLTLGQRILHTILKPCRNLQPCYTACNTQYICLDAPIPSPPADWGTGRPRLSYLSTMAAMQQQEVRGSPRSDPRLPHGRDRSRSPMAARWQPAAMPPSSCGGGTAVPSPPWVPRLRNCRSSRFLL